MPDVESEYYWIHNHFKMVMWLLLFLGGLFGILWLAQRIGGNPEQRMGSFAKTAEMARAAAAAGDHRQAIDHFSRAIERDPAVPDLWLARAESRLAIEDAKGALEDATEAGRRGANPATTAVLQARAESSLRNPKAAIAHLSHAIDADPGANEARQMRAQLYIETDQVEPALNDLNELVTRQPDNPTPRLARAELCLRCGNCQLASIEFGDLSTRPFPLPEVWLGLGTALLGLARHQEAEAAFDRALQGGQCTREVRAAAFLGRAVSLRQLGRNQDALDSWNFHAAISRQSSSPLKDAQVDGKFLFHLYFEVGGRAQPARAASP